MITPTYEEAKKYRDGYSLVPICREIFADVITPITLLRKLAQLDKHYYLLESVEGGERWGRYSFLGFHPLLHAVCEDGGVTVKSGEIENRIPGEPMEVLRGLLKEYRAPRLEGMPSFTGGFVGYFSYEMLQYAEKKLKFKESEFQDFDLMLFDKVIAYDHLRQKICVVVNAKTEEGEQGYNAAVLEIEKIIHLIQSEIPLPEEPKREPPEFACNINKKDYCAMVEKTKHYIKEGDIFQGVISRRFEAEYEGSLMNAYRVLRTTNPSPYMFFIQSDDVQIAGASPETMVKLIDGELTTFPVAGTRKRGRTPEEDRRLEEELMADEKERAEHNMLVDLARNDIGKISEYGSVKVEDYMCIHRFSKVMHIASVVTGKLKGGMDGCDAIPALLPAGTLSGAPKFRACEIIEELEPAARGIYGGAIGYMDFSGNLDVCIAIRTAVKKGGRVYVQAGAGIVADSVPEREYEECSNKAGAVIEAIRMAGEV
ncbi:anthranilate synthase component I [Qiania dongpingensis]|uniref:Anthranilate synthase component 1 n=1 Tax=Qiania dongpingensis TaxID=2763669 RepID=A0A7G9G3Q3_9FIRM|nr:anthranilate synthase component I [Qiania dongpingensis]QNM05435.1 anthranilate synthase component I [Qiania dongpingensis]